MILTFITIVLTYFFIIWIIREHRQVRQGKLYRYGLCRTPWMTWRELQHHAQTQHPTKQTKPKTETT